MANVNDDLFDRQIKRQVQMERYTQTIINRYLKLLNQADTELKKKIASYSSDTFTKKRKEKIDKWIQDEIDWLNKELIPEIEREMYEYAEIEAEFQNGQLLAAIPQEISISTATPSRTLLINAITLRPFNTRKFKEWFTDFSLEKKRIMMNTVQQGFVQGKTLQQMRSDLFGTAKNLFEDGALRTTRNSLKTALRTTINHVANVTKEETYKKSGVVKGIQLQATLDTRTSLTCMAHDGLVDYYDGSKKELNGLRPPLHPNCRSVLIPVTFSWKELGYDRDELPESTRASMDGQVPEKTTYSTWLKGKSTEFQKSILGPTRYKLWSTGKASLDNFITNNNTVISVKDLKKELPDE